MIDNPLILTFDCGTQSIRALLVDAKGNIVAKEQQTFSPYYSLKPVMPNRSPKFTKKRWPLFPTPSIRRIPIWSTASPA